METSIGVFEKVASPIDRKVKLQAVLGAFANLKFGELGKEEDEEQNQEEDGNDEETESSSSSSTSSSSNSEQGNSGSSKGKGKGKQKRRFVGKGKDRIDLENDFIEAYPGEDPEQYEILMVFSRVLAVFEKYALAKNKLEISGSKFNRLFRDAGLIGNKLSSVDVDLIFQNVVKDNETRTMMFHEFCDALIRVAERKFGTGSSTGKRKSGSSGVGSSSSSSSEGDGAGSSSDKNPLSQREKLILLVEELETVLRK
eukprot:TRINITY_DN684_c1_g2_i1.p1 TRINITY_DN684_c1_g2~~TRINITY_DN684_c1_g2_i1.p1  ORF type:complete len:255 (+),score=114.11 TRINITY_DN684_c1_g2_i1:558-1322(+)